MDQKLNKLAIAVLAAGLFSTGTVHAYETGDLIVRAGGAMVKPQDDSSLIELNGFAIPATGVEVDDNTQLGLTISYMLNSNWAIELLAATPFKHQVDAEGLGIEVADVKHLPPTLSAQFFPLGSDQAFKPYIGLGVNYTVFFGEDLRSEFISVLGDGDIELDDSFGLAFELGADLALGDNWVLNTAVWKADIDTTAKISLDSGNRIEVDVDIDPIVYMIGVGYVFK